MVYGGLAEGQVMPEPGGFYSAQAYKRKKLQAIQDYLQGVDVWLKTMVAEGALTEEGAYNLYVDAYQNLLNKGFLVFDEEAGTADVTDTTPMISGKLPFWAESRGLTTYQEVPWVKQQREEQARRARQAEIEELKRRNVRGIANIPQWSLEQLKDRVKAGELTEEQVSQFIQQRVEQQEGATARAKLSRAWQYAPPQPEYGTAYQQMEVGVPQTENWRYWFNQRYPSIVGEFKAQMPEMTQASYQGMYPREAQKQIEKSWAEYLKGKAPEIREQYYKQSPYERGLRPGYFAPRVQTVGF